MWSATAAITTFSARKVQNQLDNKKIPLMGAIGAFVFAAQMINFAIPGNGSSGHLGGDLLLAVLLGVLSCVLLAGCGGGGKSIDRVVIVSFDTTRADRLGCYGYERAATPHLDALADEAALFEKAISPVPTTLKSSSPTPNRWAPSGS